MTIVDLFMTFHLQIPAFILQFPSLDSVYYIRVTYIFFIGIGITHTRKNLNGPKNRLHHPKRVLLIWGWNYDLVLMRFTQSIINH